MTNEDKQSPPAGAPDTDEGKKAQEAHEDTASDHPEKEDAREETIGERIYRRMIQ